MILGVFFLAKICIFDPDPGWVCVRNSDVYDVFVWMVLGDSIRFIRSMIYYDVITSYVSCSTLHLDL